MSEITKPIALDESLHTTEPTPRNLADVLSDELQNLATAISGGSDKVPKTDIATVEPTNTASRAYSVGELVYVNGNLYKVITAIASGATFTVGTNIQSTNVSGTVKDALDKLSAMNYGATVDLTSYTLSNQYTAPSDGHVCANCYGNNYGVIAINGATILGAAQNVGTQLCFTTFVKKGMRLYVTSVTGSPSLKYYPIV